MAGLIAAATGMGLSARGVRAIPAALTSIPLPAIAHLADPEGRTHFVVLFAATGRTLTVMDPADGEVHRESLDAFTKRWTGVLLLLAPDAGTATGFRTDHPLARFWGLARPHRSALLQATLGAFAYTVLGLSTAIFVQKLIDYVIPDGNRELLGLLGTVMLLLAASQVYLGCTKDLLVLRTGQRIDAGLITGYYRHLMRLPQRFFDTMRVGEIVSRINDAVKIRAFVNETALEMMVNLLVVVFSFALMTVYSWRLAIVVAASIPLYLGLYWTANRINRREQRRTMEAAADLEAHLVESLGAASTLRRLGLEEHAADRLDHRLVRLLRPVYAVGRGSLITSGGAELVSRATTIALLWVGTHLVLDQAMSAGELMSFYALNGHLTQPVLGLIATNRRVQDALIAADRLFQVMDLEREKDSGHARIADGADHGVHFEAVSFRYAARSPVFERLTLSVERGEMVALVGESGAGKSTLAALLQRLYPLESGQIRIGDLDIQNIRRDSLLRSVAVVPQEIVLFAGSLLENLAPGETEPDLARLRQLCAQVGLMELIDRLPDGLATPVGERGTGLSGGQRQRVALVRALYRRPHVLVLDEATSGLDAEAERAILAVLRTLRAAGMTIVIITHRLSTARGADRILVIGEGKVLAAGTHEALLRGSAAYQRMWGQQAGRIDPVLTPSP